MNRDENDNEIHRLIIGTNTSGTEQNYIKILQVVLPQTIDDTMDNTMVGQVSEILSIPHASEVNRARFMPQATGIIAAWTDCGQVIRNINNIRYTCMIVSRIRMDLN